MKSLMFLGAWCYKVKRKCGGSYKLSHPHSSIRLQRFDMDMILSPYHPPPILTAYLPKIHQIYHYFLEDTAYIVFWFRDIVSMNYWNLIKIVKGFFFFRKWPLCGFGPTSRAPSVEAGIFTCTGHRPKLDRRLSMNTMPLNVQMPARHTYIHRYKQTEGHRWYSKNHFFIFMSADNK